MIWMSFMILDSVGSPSLGDSHCCATSCYSSDYLLRGGGSCIICIIAVIVVSIGLGSYRPRSILSIAFGHHCWWRICSGRRRCGGKRRDISALKGVVVVISLIAVVVIVVVIEAISSG